MNLRALPNLRGDSTRRSVLAPDLSFASAVWDYFESYLYLLSEEWISSYLQVIMADDADMASAGNCDLYG